MSDERRLESKLIPLISGFVLALPVLYVLSVGPVAKAIELATGDPSPPQWARQFYAPLRWLHDNTPMARPLEWYVALWGVK